MCCCPPLDKDLKEGTLHTFFTRVLNQGRVESRERGAAVEQTRSSCHNPALKLVTGVGLFQPDGELLQEYN
ncbi:hypothetical protein EYF80_051291 [Liparis tanakae]|uniref:Uncharacterized protein n=1 Tax=Liparis tanakae TaxID=230148 RepID=A0A4Z2FCQ2_9TELE|nr:hypothetical protein EYF80_051291 [Liparis tanakae]